MKAEHRKELHTNLLADRLGKMVQTVKSGPSTSSLVIWIGLGLIVVTFIVWRVYSSKATEERSGLWVRMDDALREEAGAQGKLRDLATNHRRTLPGRIARFQIARRDLQDGVRNLPSEMLREDAVKRLESARTEFAELAGETGDDPLLGAEALMSRARAEEALAGVPKADDPTQGRGDLQAALEAYRAVEKKFPTSAEAQVAKERIKIYEDEKKYAAMKLFYERLREEFGKKPLSGTGS